MISPRESLRAWVRDGRLGWIDLLVGLALLALGQLEVSLRGVAGDAALAHAAWALIALAAVLRRAAPYWFAAIVIGSLYLRGAEGLSPEGGAIQAIVTPLSVFGVGVHGRDPRVAFFGAWAAGLAAIAAYALVDLGPSGYAANQPAFQWLRIVTIELGAAFAGIALRDRSEAVLAARRRIEGMPPRRSAVEAGLAEARMRIAGDLQGVVSSCLDGIRATVERGRAALPAEPAAAAALAGEARALSREAMDEMRRMLGLLRGGEEGDRPAGPEPAAAAAGLHALLERLSPFALPLVILASGVLNAFFVEALPDEVNGDAALWIRLAGAVAMAAAFLPWRRWPVLSVLMVGALIWLRCDVLDDRFPMDIFVWSAAFVAGAYARRLTLGGLACAAMLGLSLYTAKSIEPLTPTGFLVGFGTIAAAAWLTGASCRRRLARSEELEELEAEEGARRRALTERAVEEERLSVARELHDLIGHGLTAITLQCAAAERQAAEEPVAAEESLAAVAAVVEQASGELDELLDALSASAEAERPSVERVGRLFAGLGGGSLEVEGDLASVPAAQSGAAYRIVQEALANAAKHGRPETVAARVERSGDRLRLEVTNARLAGAGERERRGGGEPGYGLIGMRERAEVFGGSIEVGPMGRDAWRVRAELPIGSAAAQALPSSV